MNKMRIYTTVLLQFVLTMAAPFVANGQSYENIYDIIAGRFSGVMVSGTDGNPNSMQSISVGGQVQYAHLPLLCLLLMGS